METLRLMNLVNYWRETEPGFVVSDGEWEEIKFVVSDLEELGVVQNVSSGNGKRSILVPNSYRTIVYNQLDALLGEPQS